MLPANPEKRINDQIESIKSLIQELDDLKEYSDSIRDEKIQKVNHVQRDQNTLLEILDLIKTDDKIDADFRAQQDSYTEERLTQLEQEEAELEKIKAQLVLEQQDLQQQVGQYLKDRPRLEKNEEGFWDNANFIEKESIELEEECSFSRLQTVYFNSELERLSKIYVLNEVFDIKYDKDMATITKLHMGQHPDNGNINWDETNAGFGHLLLLLNFLCIRNAIKVPNIEFEPLGSSSVIKISQRDNTVRECRLSGPPADEVRTTHAEILQCGPQLPDLRSRLHRQAAQSKTFRNPPARRRADRPIRRRAEVQQAQSSEPDRAVQFARRQASAAL